MTNGWAVICNCCRTIVWYCWCRLAKSAQKRPTLYKTNTLKVIDLVLHLTKSKMNIDLYYLNKYYHIRHPAPKECLKHFPWYTYILFTVPLFMSPLGGISRFFMAIISSRWNLTCKDSRITFLIGFFFIEISWVFYPLLILSFAFAHKCLYSYVTYHA